MFEKTKTQESESTVGWFSLKEMAEIFAISPQAFSKSVRPLLAETAVKDSGKRGVRIHCRAAIDVWAAKKADQAAEAAKKAADPLLVGETSPALEEYRRHRAGLAKIELEMKQRTHVDLAGLNTTLNRFANLMRRAAEVLQRRFGNEASDIFNTAIDEAEQTLKNELGSNANHP